MTYHPPRPARPGTVSVLVFFLMTMFLPPAPADSTHEQEGPGDLSRACVLVHGGAGTPLDRTPDLIPAVEAAWRILEAGGGALEAAVAAAANLEDNPHLNAGTGSNIRMDGETVQMDAAVMNDRGDFGAVAVIERVRNPVIVAREVMNSPHLLLAGAGATAFARTLGMKDYDPRCAESMERYRVLRQRMIRGELGTEWRDFDWKEHWNFPMPLDEALAPRDTIGAVVRDGRGGFAAAISTGGTSTTLYGRVGDVPIMGAGIFVGEAGAACSTGWGEYIVREMLTRRVHDWMASGEKPESAVARGLALYPVGINIGLLALGPEGEFAASNTSMAWAGRSGSTLLRADVPAR